MPSTFDFDPVMTLDMCCGRAKCPILRLNLEGELTIQDGDQEVVFSAAQTGQLRKWLEELYNHSLVK